MPGVIGESSKTDDGSLILICSHRFTVNHLVPTSPEWNEGEGWNEGVGIG